MRTALYLLIAIALAAIFVPHTRAEIHPAEWHGIFQPAVYRFEGPVPVRTWEA